LILMLSLPTSMPVCTVVVVSSDFMQTEILSWKGIRSLGFLSP
jgi:hypothetical protein